MTTTAPIKIAVIGGDGTGPEVAAEGIKVLEAVARLEDLQYELVHFDYGGDRYLRTAAPGNVLSINAHTFNRPQYIVQNCL